MSDARVPADEDEHIALFKVGAVPVLVDAAWQGKPRKLMLWGNRNAFYYVLVERTKLDAFLRAFESDCMELTDYGKIIASCYGEEPTQEIKDFLKEKYDFDVR